MKTAFISRFGGFGDVMHASHLPELIKKHYGVDRIDFETNYQGYQILQNNPFIDNLNYVDFDKMTENRFKKSIEYAQYKYDMVFNLINSIELEYCLQEFDTRYYRGHEYRRERFGKTSYYDVMTKFVGLPDEYLGTRGKLYYSEEDHELARNWTSARRKDGFDFIVIVNLSGSSLHKKFMQAEEVCRRILDLYPKAYILLTGDEACKDQVFEHERVVSKVGKWNFRTIALQCKYADLNISLESGFAVVAHSWDAPTLQLLTAASFDNHIKYAKNAWFIQSPVYCSPCHRNPDKYFGCPVKEKMPACVWFDVDEIIAKVSEAYERSQVLA